VQFLGASILGGFLNNLAIKCTVCGMERSGQYEEYSELRAFWNKLSPNKDLYNGPSIY
jgi:hypothetical protein